MLEYPNRSRLFVHDGGDLGDRESPEDAKHDDLGLVSREAGDTREGGPGRQSGHRFFLDVSARPVRGEPVSFHRLGITAPSPPPQIDHSPTCDRECPRPECGFPAAESGEPDRDLQPYVGGEIFGLTRFDGSDVPEQAWEEVPIQLRERQLFAGGRTGQPFLEGVEFVRQGITSIGSWTGSVEDPSPMGSSHCCKIRSGSGGRRSDDAQVRSRADSHVPLVNWIERTYHRRRRQRGLSKLTPVEFELLFEAAHAA